MVSKPNFIFTEFGRSSGHFYKEQLQVVFLVDGHANALCCVGNKVILLRYLEKGYSTTCRSSGYFDVKIKIRKNTFNFIHPVTLKGGILCAALC
jgi:hypothetical protein